MKEICIYKSTKKVMVDDEDYLRLSIYVWHLTGSCRTAVTTVIGKLTIPIANIILCEFKGMYDHKDRNSLNNQKYNLRLATPRQNSYNRGKTKSGSTSLYKGVSWTSDPKVGSKNWKAGIKYNGRKIHLGYFNNEWDAALAYNKAAQKYFKEFATLNVCNKATL